MKVSKWTPSNRRKKGRPKRIWKTEVKKAIDRRGLNKQKCQDKREQKLGCKTRPRAVHNSLIYIVYIHSYVQSNWGYTDIITAVKTHYRIKRFAWVCTVGAWGVQAVAPIHSPFCGRLCKRLIHTDDVCNSNYVIPQVAFYIHWLLGYGADKKPFAFESCVSWQVILNIYICLLYTSRCV